MTAFDTVTFLQGRKLMTTSQNTAKSDAHTVAVLFLRSSLQISPSGGKPGRAGSPTLARHGSGELNRMVKMRIGAKGPRGFSVVNIVIGFSERKLRSRATRGESQ